MMTLVVPIVLGLAVTAQTGPSPAELERAHRLLAGTWDVLEMVDDGETLTRDLIRSKLAAGGRLRVVDRSFEIINPETGEARTTAFRIDPSQNPRRIDVISRDDRILRGIYRFEGDQLVICQQTKPEEPRPDTFEARAGSGRMLLRLKLASDSSVVSAPASSATKKEAPEAAPATAAAPRRPTESEIARVRDLFKGHWDIVSILDDGQSLGPELIRRKSAQGGRVQFGTRAFATTDPRTEERRTWAYRIDPSKNPSQIDVTTQYDSVLKGIYTFEGDALSVCVAKHEDGARPTAFDAPSGSDRMLIRLKLAASDQKPAPSAPPPPSSAESDEAREARIRRLIVGSWAMTDRRGTLTIAFDQGGTFSGKRVYSKSAKTMFGPVDDWAKGNWSFGDGALDATVTTTTDRNLVGRSVCGQVDSIDNDTMVISDFFGNAKTYRRLE
jgi:uncharacterized protein (TIGR03067 family)